jgi:methyl-accepting chemotaxis protein
VHDRAIAMRDAVLVDNDQALERQLQEIQRLKAFYQESAQNMDSLLREQVSSATEKRLLADIREIERSTLALTEQLISQRRQGRYSRRQRYSVKPSGAGLKRMAQADQGVY